MWHNNRDFKEHLSVRISNMKLWLIRWSLKAKMSECQLHFKRYMWNDIANEWLVCCSQQSGIGWAYTWKKREFINMTINPLHWNISAWWNMWLKCYVQNIWFAHPLSLSLLLCHFACIECNAYFTLCIIDIFLMFNCWKLFRT